MGILLTDEIIERHYEKDFWGYFMNKYRNAKIAELTGLEKHQVTQIVKYLYKKYNAKSRSTLYYNALKSGKLKSEEIPVRIKNSYPFL